MTLQSSGRITIGDISVELGRPRTQTGRLGETDFRNLAEKYSGRIALSDFYGKSNYQPGSLELLTPGTYSFTTGKGVKSLYVDLQGGGGGGGAGGTGDDDMWGAYGAGGGGGGAGNRITGWYTVTPGQAFTIVVGSGGAGGVYVYSHEGAGAAGTNGGDTYVSGLVGVSGGGAGGGGGGGNDDSGIGWPGGGGYGSTYGEQGYGRNREWYWGYYYESVPVGADGEYIEVKVDLYCGQGGMGASSVYGVGGTRGLGAVYRMQGAGQYPSTNGQSVTAGGAAAARGAGGGGGGGGMRRAPTSIYGANGGRGGDGRVYLQW